MTEEMLLPSVFKPKKPIILMSVYDRMLNDEKLFWLGYGVLYLTEMRRVKGFENPELRIKSKGLAEKWFQLFEKYGVLSKKSHGINVHNGIYSFGSTVQSLYKLLSVVGKIPERKMDAGIRKRISKIVYVGDGEINLTRIRILKKLVNEALTTNELARQIHYCSGNVFRLHLEALFNLGFIKRQPLGKQTILNNITEKGSAFVNCFENRIEKAPKDSLYNKCFTNKQLASDLLMIACELEMGGIMQRALSLNMTSKDFVEFALSIGKKWGWTNYHSAVKRKRPKKWNTTYLVCFNAKLTKEIYLLSGPCADEQKDKYFRHSFKLNRPGQHRKVGQTKEEILTLVENRVFTSKDLALELNIGIQNIQRSLLTLAKAGKIKRKTENKGFSYSKILSIADAN